MFLCGGVVFGVARLVGLAFLGLCCLLCVLWACLSFFGVLAFGALSHPSVLSEGIFEGFGNLLSPFECNPFGRGNYGQFFHRPSSLSVFAVFGDLLALLCSFFWAFPHACL